MWPLLGRKSLTLVTMGREGWKEEELPWCWEILVGMSRPEICHGNEDGEKWADSGDSGERISETWWMVGFEGERGVKVTVQVFDMSKFIQTGDSCCTCICVYVCEHTRVRAKVGERRQIPPHFWLHWLKQDRRNGSRRPKIKTFCYSAAQAEW